MKSEFLLSEAQAMAPLVRRILVDIASAHSLVQHRRGEVNRLRPIRRSARYEYRKLHHQALRDLGDAELSLEETTSELGELGVVLLDSVRGLAGFPFLCSLNEGSKDVSEAYFLLKLWDNPRKGIRNWKLKEEDKERTVPSHWFQPLPELPAEKGVETAPDQEQ